MCFKETVLLISLIIFTFCVIFIASVLILWFGSALDQIKKKYVEEWKNENTDYIFVFFYGFFTLK